MPIYEYQCAGCDHVMEVILGEPPARCERCGRPGPVRVLSAHRVQSSAPAAGESLCCGRTSRPAECVPGSCCGEAAGGGHGSSR
jgi:putative FmdB family regulatory protein